MGFPRWFDDWGFVWIVFVSFSFLVTKHKFIACRTSFYKMYAQLATQMVCLSKYIILVWRNTHLYLKQRLSVKKYIINDFYHSRNSTSNEHLRYRAFSLVLISVFVISVVVYTTRTLKMTHFLLQDKQWICIANAYLYNFPESMMWQGFWWWERFLIRNVLRVLYSVLNGLYSPN